MNSFIAQHFADTLPKHILLGKEPDKAKVRPYVDLHTIYENLELESDSYKIETFTLTENHVKMERVRSMMDGNGWTTVGLRADFPYVKLIKKGEGIMMSDTPMERNSNRKFVEKANGDVLIFGLGLGLVIFPLLADDKIRSITVLELDKSLIEMVKPVLEYFDVDKKLNIINADCFEYYKQMDTDVRFDVIYGDIWIDISTDNWSEMKLLTQKYRGKVNRKNPDSFMTHWLKDYIQQEHHREKSTAYGSYW